ESKAEQRLKRKEYFFSILLVNNSPPTASPMLEGTAEEEGSSVSEPSAAVPQTTETPWQERKKGPRFLSTPGSPNSPDGVSLRDLLESKVRHHLHLLVPSKALWTFLARVTRALRMDCRLPEVQLACAKMVSKTGQLVQVLSKKRDDALAGKSLQERNICSSMAPAGKEATGKVGERYWKPEYIGSISLLLAISVSSVVMVTLGICLIEACSQKPAATSQRQSTSKFRWKWFFQKLLPQRWRKNNDDFREHSSCIWDPSQPKPQWLTALSQPLDSQHKKHIAELYDEETSEEEEDIFSRFELE
ncbi:L37A1 protein, partial [Lophotis ruficrista]|nr:L37A1 protein [Lophotis ruficrista]